MTTLPARHNAMTLDDETQKALYVGGGAVLSQLLTWLLGRRKARVDETAALQGLVEKWMNRQDASLERVVTENEELKRSNATLSSEVAALREHNTRLNQTVSLLREEIAVLRSEIHAAATGSANLAGALTESQGAFKTVAGAVVSHVFERPDEGVSHE